MQTKLILEALMYKDKNIHKALRVLNIISPERLISAVERKEYDNILKPFSNGGLKIINVVGLSSTTFIINTKEPADGRGRLNTMIIRGHITEITTWSAGGLVKEINSSLNKKDFLPLPLLFKIIYIDDYSKDYPIGVVFSECLPNQWTLDDPLKLDINLKTVKTTSRQIINELVQSFKEVD